jgi:hypothetical protein
MKKILSSETLLKSELEELHKFLNEINKKISVNDPIFMPVYKEVRDTCLYRINLLEGWLKELVTLKIN